MFQNGDTLFTAFKGDNWKCLPTDLDLEVGGQISSDTYSFLQLQISRCNTTNSKCVSDAEFDAL